MSQSVPATTSSGDVQDQELEKFLDFMISAMPPAVADFFGIKVRRVRLSKTKRKKILAELKELTSGLETLQKIKPPFRSRAEWVAGLDALDIAMRPFLDPPFRRMHFADYLRQSYLELIEAPLDTRFFSETSYERCCDEIDSIASELFRTQRQTLADKLFVEVGQSSDAGILGQALIVHTPKIIEYLRKPKRRFRRYDIDRLIRCYSQLSGYYEKSLRMVIGMLEAVEGREPAYSALAKHKLFTNMAEVEKAHPILSRDFNIVVRNSIAHGSHYFHYANQTVDFHDISGKSVTWTFVNLFRECRKLSALAMATMMSYFIFQSRRWQNTWDAYCEAKRAKRKTKEGRIPADESSRTI